VAAETFLFEALSEKAQQAALDRYRYCWADYDWWDNTYEDAARMAEILGIEIDKHYGKAGNGPKIFFSGFCSQGDGACFLGWYRPKGDVLSAMKAECTDETLISLAERLTVLGVTLALYPGFEELKARITANDRYCHSGTMQFSIEYEPQGIDSFDDFPAAHTDDEIESCMREFADWIYQQLEAEHDYLISDEYLKERFAEDETKFDEDGAMI